MFFDSGTFSHFFHNWLPFSSRALFLKNFFTSFAELLENGLTNVHSQITNMLRILQKIATIVNLFSVLLSNVLSCCGFVLSEVKVPLDMGGAIVVLCGGVLIGEAKRLLFDMLAVRGVADEGTIDLSESGSLTFGTLHRQII